MVVVVTGQLTQHISGGFRETVAAGVTEPVTVGAGADRYSSKLRVAALRVPAIVMVELACTIVAGEGWPPAPRADRIRRST